MDGLQKYNIYIFHWIESFVYIVSFYAQNNPKYYIL